MNKFPFLTDTSIQHNQKSFYLVLSGFFVVVVIILPITQNVPVSSPGIITWSLFSTLSSAIHKLICSKLTSHLKHCTAGNSFFSYFIFFLNFKESVGYGFKENSFFSEIWTLIAEFKLQISIYFTTEPNKKTTKMGLVPTLIDPNGLTVHRLNHSAIMSIKVMT